MGKYPPIGRMYQFALFDLAPVAPERFVLVGSTLVHRPIEFCDTSPPLNAASRRRLYAATWQPFAADAPTATSTNAADVTML